jgi:hypothetical protein
VEKAILKEISKRRVSTFNWCIEVKIIRTSIKAKLSSIKNDIHKAMETR